MTPVLPPQGEWTYELLGTGSEVYLEQDLLLNGSSCETDMGPGCFSMICVTGFG